MVPTLFEDLATTQDVLSKSTLEDEVGAYHPCIFKASAPGSLMLLGEHAVLHNRKALVMALNQRIQTTLKPRQDDKIVINSALGQYETTLSTFNKKAPFQFVLAAIETYKSLLRQGFTLDIQADFSHTLGFGSSAAVVVATLKVVSNYCSESPLNGLELFNKAKKIIIDVQGMGSGADVAASVFGGLILYQNGSLLQRAESLPPIVAVYSGYKTPTPDVIKQVEARFRSKPLLLDSLFDSMEICTEEAFKTVAAQDWITFGQYMNVAQGLLYSLGVSDTVLEQKLFELRKEPGIFGAKISGAGLGDCVIGIGQVSKTLPGMIPMLPSLQGAADA